MKDNYFSPTRVIRTYITVVLSIWLSVENKSSNIFDLMEISQAKRKNTFWYELVYFATLVVDSMKRHHKLTPMDISMRTIYLQKIHVPISSIIPQLIS